MLFHAFFSFCPLVPREPIIPYTFSFLYERMYWNVLSVAPSMVMWCVIFPKGESMAEPNVLNDSRCEICFIVFVFVGATMIRDSNCFFSNIQYTRQNILIALVNTGKTKC